jgi:beta-phosphoglucomutase family hydrolase
VLGLPDSVTACLFDLDGVLTQTAHVHNAAWEEMFNAYLQDRATKGGGSFVPFDPDRDYREHVDGRSRADGVRTFLASRGITLPDGSPDDPADAETVNGLGNRKNMLFLRRLKEGGVQTYDGSVAYLRAARDAGLRRAVVSASKNCCDVVEAAGLTDLLEERVDGVVAAEEGLRGKPAPDTFLAGARRLGVAPSQAVVFEDAISGVQAGRAGNFGYVVGVDRVGQGSALRENGADVVVEDLSELMREPAS